MSERKCSSVLNKVTCGGKADEYYIRLLLQLGRRREQRATV